ncbi:hypothetical protein EJB05_00925, partial [Eragrostis curvula]
MNKFYLVELANTLKKFGRWKIEATDHVRFEYRDFGGVKAEAHVAFVLLGDDEIGDPSGLPQLQDIGFINLPGLLVIDGLCNLAGVYHPLGFGGGAVGAGGVILVLRILLSSGNGPIGSGKHLTLTERLKTRLREMLGSGVSSTGISRISSSAAHQRPQKGLR